MERFQSICATQYRGADCCMLVYNIMDYKSFENIESWKSKFIKNCSADEPENVPLIVVGNKSDEELKRKVQTPKAEH